MLDNDQTKKNLISRRKLLSSIGAFGAIGVAMTLGGKSIYSSSPDVSASVTQSVYGSGNGGVTDNDNFYNVAYYGATGDGIHDDTTAFETVLQEIRVKGFGTCFVPAGSYIITRPLQLYKNTTILMDDNAVLKKMGIPNSNLKLFSNGQLGNSNYASGYNGEGNITVIGGTIDLCANVNLPSDPSRGFMAFAIGHADGIHIERVRFVNGHNGHIIEFNSSKNVKLIHCKFENQIITTSGMFEMVQIDFASKESFPSFGAYDDTPCQNVLIEGCTFANGHRGVGAHGSKYNSEGKQVFHENIRIVNNHFVDLADVAIRPESFFNSVISGNTISNVGGHGIPIYSCRNTIISNNVLRGTGFHGIVVTKAGDINDPSVYITVTNNVISDVMNTALRVINGQDILLTDNTVYNVKREGIYASAATRLIAKNNHLRGISQEKSGLYSGIHLDGCTGSNISANIINNDDFNSKYSYIVLIASNNHHTVVNGNFGLSGLSGLIKDDASGTLVTTNPTEQFLTGVINISSGTIDLNDDIRNYKSILVATGAVANGNLRHESARGWSTSGFRPGTDFINVSTANGTLVASILTETKLQLISSSDPVRYIIGIKG
ncbi:right-handed parallel beta-helix repeat-containing protein [Paenibacillus sp. UNC451MF]|uniref:right-handed parallel beta-helix repeat-containing protein n=1 Tax=Paenibacillus sp. UNC451MF TaxID=1449063 RepID=UPI00055EA86E|nr:right-handed parallel beta-helix repeat-containing protein [Paenibacillus sp. UNC451MF]